MPDDAERPFMFKHIKNGAQLQPNEIPKLPAAAIRCILQHEAALVASGKKDGNAVAQMLNAMAVDIVTMALRRIEPALTSQQVADDEDCDEVMRLFRHIQSVNTAIFPPAPSPKPAA